MRRILLLLLFFPVSVFPTAPAHRQSEATDLEWPPITAQARPWTRWWWLGSIVDEDSLTEELEKYAKAGIGGLEITPIYGVRGLEERFIRFLSPAWVQRLAYTLREATRLGMGVDLATGTGWPFGGPWVGVDEACRSFVYKKYALNAGETLNERVGHVQKALVRAVGRRVSISDIEEPIDVNDNLQALALDQVRFEKPLPLVALMAYSDRGSTLNLTDKVDEAGKLSWSAPQGAWTLYAVFGGWHGKMVERAAPGGEGNVIDHFSETALTRYLERFDRAFAGQDLGSMRAFFNDSYEVDDAEGQSNWTPRFFEEFEARRGYDIRGHLPALFGDDTPEKSSRVLCDYRETISDLLLERFTIPWQRWAARLGAVVRNQAHGSPANLLDLYAASDIPETEGTDILRMKFASSAAHVAGRPLASSESATWLDEHFVASLGDVKRAVDHLFLGGVNHVFYHGTPFSPSREEWPGWLFYASVHFGPTNSFWDDFPALNAYVSRSQSFLQSGLPDHDVLLYFPIHDQWSERGTSLLKHFGGGVDSTMTQGDARELMESGHAFDFVSDRQIDRIVPTGAMLHTGGVSYKALLVPATRLIPLSTLEKLVDLARNGAVIIFRGGLPSDVPGWSDLDRRRSAFRRLLSGIRFSRPGSSDIQSAKVGRGTIHLGRDLNRLLSRAGVERESLVDRGLRFVRRRHSTGRHYFILNDGNTALETWVPLRTGATSVAIFDPLSGDKGVGAARPASSGGIEVYLQLEPGQSVFIRTLDHETQGAPYKLFKAGGEPRRIRGAWNVRFVSGGPELPPALDRADLGSWTGWGVAELQRFSGTAVYSIPFERPPEAPAGWRIDLGRVADSARVRLNGRDLGTLISPPFRVQIPAEWIAEKNSLEIAVSNLMANRIADMDRRGVEWKRFYNINMPARRRENIGPDGLFNASLWPPRDSGLIGPVTLTPLEILRIGR